MDGINFTELGREPGAGTTNQAQQYDMVDHEPYELSYYRLKQTDFDGDFTYSETILIAMDQITPTLTSLYPNPASDFISLNIQADEVQELTVYVYSITGAVVIAQQLGALSSGVYNNVINVSALANGVYYVGLKAGEQISKQKLIIAR